MKRKEPEKHHSTPIVTLSGRCNQDCVFCCGEGLGGKHSRARVKRLLEQAGDRLQIGGWEPTLSEDLVRFVKSAKRRGIREIVLRTNGVALSDRSLARALVEAGVTTFHVNFPSHDEALADALTRLKGSHRKRVRGIKNVLESGAGSRVGLVFVVIRDNFRTMLEYVRFVHREFPGISYISINLVCQLGKAEKDKALVPTYREVEPHLAAAARYCRKNDLRILVDDIPVCFMAGFEQDSVDFRRAVQEGRFELSELKQKQEPCLRCSLSLYCLGPKLEYVRLHGWRELKPSTRNPEDIKKLIPEFRRAA